MHALLSILAVDALHTRLKKAWCAQTSQDPAWHSQTPTLGQCAVTALVAQDLCNLPIIRGWAVVHGNRQSHYWNAGCDLTADQFPANTVFLPRTDLDPAAIRPYLLGNLDTHARYTLLKTKVLLCDLY